MPNKTLSVRVDDLPLWERAERAAKEARTTVSALVATALARHLGETGTITVQMYDYLGPTREERFEGRWLVDPDLDSDQVTHPEYSKHSGRLSGDPVEWCAGVAETGRGRIAVYLHHWNYHYEFPPELHVFDSIDTARKQLADDPRIPDGLLTGISPAADRVPVVWRDI